MSHVQKGAVMMQHPLEIGAHYYPAEVQQDHRSHHYTSFMIEEILSEHPGHKASPPAGDLLKFEVHTLLSAQPYPNHLDKSDMTYEETRTRSRGALSKTNKGRRSRTVFTELQLMGLEKRFEKQKYLSTPDRIDLANQWQVKTWNQNRRMKWKKIVLQGGGLESPTKPKGRPKNNPIPSGEQLPEQERERTREAESASSSSSTSSSSLSCSGQSEPSQEE